MPRYYHLDAPGLVLGAEGVPETKRCDLMDEMQVVEITLGQTWLLVYVNRVNVRCEELMPDLWLFLNL